MSKTFIDFFAGIGGFRRGMELAGHKCVGFCEFDPFATKSYKAMHLVNENQRKYLMSLEFKARQKEITKEDYLNGEWYANDIRRVEARNMPKADIWCFGAPCQDFSIAGNRAGLEGDRSSLVREVFRIVAEYKEEDRPEYLIYENVKGMLSSNNGWDFACIIVEMESLGYDIEYQLLNSKDFGVPQNRERVFIIGHLRGRSRRKVFPVSGSSKSFDIKIIGSTKGKDCTRSGQRDEVYSKNGIMGSLSATDYKQPKQIAIPVLTPDRIEKRQNGRRFKEDGEEMFTLTAQDRHGVMVREATKQGYSIAEEGDSINLEQPNSETRRGRVGKGVAQTLTTSCNQATLDSMRIRKLTPRECFRLQGWTDEYFERAASVNSDSQLYKQAGNGVTVSVIKAIAERL